MYIAILGLHFRGFRLHNYYHVSVHCRVLGMVQHYHLNLGLIFIPEVDCGLKSNLQYQHHSQSGMGD